MRTLIVAATLLLLAYVPTLSVTAKPVRPVPTAAWTPPTPSAALTSVPLPGVQP